MKLEKKLKIRDLIELLESIKCNRDFVIHDPDLNNEYEFNEPLVVDSMTVLSFTMPLSSKSMDVLLKVRNPKLKYVRVQILKTKTLDNIISAIVAI